MYDDFSKDIDRSFFKGYSNKTLSPKELLGQRNLSLAPMRRSIRQSNPQPVPQPTPSPYSRMPLQVGLDISYTRNEGDVISKLKPYGYTYDTALSTKENKVFYNPFDNKVVMSVSGTDPFNRRDVGTDLYLAFGGQEGLQKTDRYKEAESVMKKVRGKYKGQKKTLIGHSLGSAIINTLANDDEIVKGFGTGSGFFPTKRKGEGYRTFYDPFSFTSSDTIIAPYKPEKKDNLRASQVVDFPQGLLPSHSFQNLKNKNIFV